MVETDDLKVTENDLGADKTGGDRPLVSDTFTSGNQKTLVAGLTQSRNSIELGGKTFSVLVPEVNKEDVFAGPEGYENVTYVKGLAVSREAQKAGKKFFMSIDDAKAFLAKYVPGATEAERIRNFAQMLGLEMSGYRDAGGGWIDQKYRGGAWLVIEQDGENAWNLTFDINKDSGYIEHGIDVNEYNVVNGRPEFTGSTHHTDKSYPVVCFQD